MHPLASHSEVKQAEPLSKIRKASCYYPIRDRTPSGYGTAGRMPGMLLSRVGSRVCHVDDVGNLEHLKDARCQVKVEMRVDVLQVAP